MRSPCRSLLLGVHTIALAIATTVCLAHPNHVALQNFKQQSMKQAFVLGSDEYRASLIHPQRSMAVNSDDLNATITVATTSKTLTFHVLVENQSAENIVELVPAAGVCSFIAIDSVTTGQLSPLNPCDEDESFTAFLPAEVDRIISSLEPPGLLCSFYKVLNNNTMLSRGGEILGPHGKTLIVANWYGQYERNRTMRPLNDARHTASLRIAFRNVNDNKCGTISIGVIATKSPDSFIVNDLSAMILPTKNSEHCKP